ncbi:MAG: sulfite exporter TauE/SafE family protein [Pirellula sp.]
MDTPTKLLWLSLFVAAIAWLYSSVGHAGASGYIALMTIFGMAPAEIKPLALLLNVLVASIATIQFYRGGHFRWSLFWPFALLSVPMAFLGGAVAIPTVWFKRLLGGVLGLSAAWFLRESSDRELVRDPPRGIALGAGAGIGLLSGITGTGGGIFLTPLLLVLGWSKTKSASAISAPFILLNSLSGLGGWLASGGPLPVLFWPMAAAVVLGGSAGATLGSFRLPVRVARVLLAVVMIVAATKLLAT